LFFFFKIFVKKKIIFVLTRGEAIPACDLRSDALGQRVLSNFFLKRNLRSCSSCLNFVLISFLTQNIIYFVEATEIKITRNSDIVEATASKRQDAGAALQELHKILLTRTSPEFIYTVFRNISYESCRTQPSYAGLSAAGQEGPYFIPIFAILKF
jgi:hypothetical protein